MIPPLLRIAFDAAVAAGDSMRGTTSPNPPVGAAIVDRNGDIVGIGSTQPPGENGGAHAEVMALRAAGSRAEGGIAVVTLEPCNHQGRTGPCTQALINAGISEVFYAVSDPNPVARGGGEFLRSQGVLATCVNEEVPGLIPWLDSVRLGRPHVTVKTAHTLDGFAAAKDGSSQWITGEEARAHAHRDRSCRDAIVVGTGTVLADNPMLTARQIDGALYPHQPQRVVIGTRDIPEGLHLAADDVWVFPDIDAAMSALWDSGLRDILVEGGPTLVGGFIELDLVDSIHAYVSPSLLGTGLSAIHLPTSASSMDDIIRFDLHRVQQFDTDLLIEARARRT